MMNTYTGRVVDLVLPSASMICIEDIAHALSLICRYNGHVYRHYSVAQHSVYVARAVRPELALAGLLHDAAEAYLGDVTHDLKHCDEMRGYRVLEHRFERLIAQRFDLTYPQLNDPEIKLADRRLAVTEKRDLFTFEPTWQHPEYHVEPYPDHIVPWSSSVAENVFLNRFQELGGK